MQYHAARCYWPAINNLLVQKSSVITQNQIKLKPMIYSESAFENVSNYFCELLTFIDNISARWESSPKHQMVNFIAESISQIAS